jgi:ketosteroid isomerase-like protein
MKTLTEAHIETVRGFYADINSNTIQAMLKTLDPNFAWTEPESYPGGGTRRGREAIEAHFIQARATWAEGACTPERFILAGDKIVVPVHIRVRLKEAKDWIDARAADVFTFRDGHLIEGRHFPEKAEALAFAGAKE